MQKGFTPILILVGILVLVGVAGGVYYLGQSGKSEPEIVSQPQSTTVSKPASASSSETKDWKTYTSKYGYSFQYPTAWNVTSINLETDDEVRIEFEDPKSPPTEWQIQLKIPQELPKNKTFDVWVKNHFPASSDLPQKEKEVTVSGINKAKEITTSYEGVSKLLLIPYQSKVYILKFNVLFGQIKIYEETVYNQILSTFKFLN